MDHLYNQYIIATNTHIRGSFSQIKPIIGDISGWLMGPSLGCRKNVTENGWTDKEKPITEASLIAVLMERWVEQAK